MLARRSRIAGTPPARVDVVHVPRAARRDLRQVGRPVGDVVDPLDRVVEPRLAGDRQRVEDGVRRAPHRHVEGEGVVDRLAGDDLSGGQVGGDQVDDARGSGLRDLVALRGPGERGPVERERQAERLHEAVHRVGGEEPRAGAAGGARVLLQLGEPRLADRPGPVGADALEDGDEVDRLPGAVAAGRHRAARDEDGRDVEADGRHQHPGGDLVAVGDADHPVEAVGREHRLHAVGDQLAGREGELHPLVPHRDPVVDADGVELEGDGAGGPDGRLHQGAELAEVDVAGDDVDVGVDDRDERLVPVVLADDSRGAQQAPVRRPLDSLLDLVRSHRVSVPLRRAQKRRPPGFPGGRLISCGSWPRSTDPRRADNEDRRRTRTSSERTTEPEATGLTGVSGA